MTRSLLSASVFAFLSVQTLGQETEFIGSEPVSAEPVAVSTPVVVGVPVVGVPVTTTDTETVTEYENVYVDENNVENGDLNHEDLLPIGEDEIHGYDINTPYGTIGAATVAAAENSAANAVNNAYNSVDSNTQQAVNNLVTDAKDLSDEIDNDVVTAVSGTTVSGTLAPGAEQAAVNAANNLGVDTSNVNNAVNSAATKVSQAKLSDASAIANNVASNANDLAGQVSNLNVATTDAANNAMNNIANAGSAAVTKAGADSQTVANTVGPLNIPSSDASNAQNVLSNANISPAVSNTISTIGNAIQTSLRPSQ